VSARANGSKRRACSGLPRDGDEGRGPGEAVGLLAERGVLKENTSSP